MPDSVEVPWGRCEHYISIIEKTTIV